MPTDFSISLDQYTSSRSVRIPSDFGPPQALVGFDPDYKNIVDYIVRITHRIWETDSREVEYIGETYSKDSRVFDDYGLQLGCEKIISDTHHTTGAFPDIILDAEEVIWAGDDSTGFHTSHLTRIIGTNTGISRYGEPKDKKISVMVIANCIALENEIFHEHVLYNTSAMLQQLDIDLWEEAERLISDPPAGWPRSDEVWVDLRQSAAPTKPLYLSEPSMGFDQVKLKNRSACETWQAIPLITHPVNLIHLKAQVRKSSPDCFYISFISFPSLKKTICSPFKLNIIGVAVFQCAQITIPNIIMNIARKLVWIKTH